MVLTNSVWACVVAGEPGIHPIRLLDAVIASSWLHVNLPRKKYDFLQYRQKLSSHKKADDMKAL